MVQAQEYLDKFYPKEQRKNIVKLNIREKSLQGSLELEGFIKLEKFDCSYNQLTILDFSNDLNSEKLTHLDISNNNFPESDLTPFSKFVNLEHLKLNNNKFTGSLESLKNMNKLKKLDISDTDINSGLEYLLESVESFWCSTNQREDAKVKTIEQEFKYFDQDLKKLREFSSSAKEWLDKNYLENEREKITELDISYEEIDKWKKEKNKKIKLRGGLRLKGFTNLKSLNCLNHQLTNLDLSDCLGLIELNCSNNELYDLSFLKGINKLEKLLIQNNPKLVAKNWTP